MNPWDLKNNALFLSCWYERSRPVAMICFGVLILSILLLMFLSVSTRVSSVNEIWLSMFYVLAGVQALVLLLQGTLFAAYMGSRERSSETLNFHRNSPEPVMAKVLGLILGSACLEWCVFGAIFLLELPFAFLANIPAWKIGLLNVSVALSGIFFHTTAATLSLLSQQKTRGSKIGMVFFFYGS